MTEAKRYGPTCDCMSEMAWGDYVLASDYDALAQRPQEAERLLQIAYDHGRYRRLSDDELGQIDAFLSGKP